MKKVFNLSLCFFVSLLTLAQMPELTVEQQLEDYDDAVKYIEDNYSGFPEKITAATCEGYETMKSSLRRQVQQGERPGYDAAAQYMAWFNDGHLCAHIYFEDEQGNWVGLTEKYNPKRQPIHYESQMEYNPKAVACKVTDKTFLIRFPSCDGDPDMKWIRKSVKQFKKSGCENLILDIRGNTGGSDLNWEPYFIILADHNGWQPGSEYRNTPQNIDYLQRVGWPVARDLQREASLHPDAEFLLGKPMVKRYRVRRPYTEVKRAAVIIDNRVASSGEGLLQCLRAYSDRAKFYGRDNTSGCLDHANVATIRFKHCGRTFQMPMSRRVGLPWSGIDATGIAPDVRIPLPLPARLIDNVDEWTIWVAEQLEK